MTQSARDLESTFARSLQLLLGNWIIVIPGLLLAVLGGLLAVVGNAEIGSFVITGNGNAEVSAIDSALSNIVPTVIGALLAILQMAFVTGMAGAAWERGTTSLRDGWWAFSHRSIQTTFAMLLLLLLGAVAAILAYPTLYLSTIAYVVFFVYTMPAVIIGRNVATRAVGQSCQLALANFLPTLGLVALVFIIAILGGKIGDAIDRWSDLVGSIAGLVIQEIIVAYAALVVTGEYLKLRKSAPAASPPPDSGS